MNSWKAAPRDGVWATGPFLHNGSVPNLYEMLVPASQRSKKFYVGREFDPVKVGIDTSGKSGMFLFDTSLIGNSNAGHSFQNGPRGNGVIGPLLTDAQRWALVEYLKSIPEEPGRVTPYGGPPNARTGKSAVGQRAGSLSPGASSHESTQIISGRVRRHRRCPCVRAPLATGQRARETARDGG